MIKTILKDAEDRMRKAEEVVRQELAKIRTGKATTAILDGIKVDYYGTMTQLTHMANVGVADIHTLTVQPYEKTMLDTVLKAIQTANLGLNPIKDAELVRVPIPPLNEERRRELVKLTKKFGEDGKVAIRNIRRHAKDAIEAEDVSEDDIHRAEKELQDLTDAHTAAIDEALARKEEELLEV